MSNFTAVYDACVLYPAPLRDFLMQLALSDLFRAKWTDRIHDEWIRNLRANRPDIRVEQLERTRFLMNKNVRDCLVTDYACLEPCLVLPDPDDRHVLAAAIKAGADVIVTFNLDDFPSESLKPWGIEAQHPDEFLSHLIDLSPETICQTARICRARLRNPALDVSSYLGCLERQQLVQTVVFLGENHLLI